MATIEKYGTSSGATRYRVRYRTPDRRQTDKRGFRTKRDAEAWANQLEVDKRRGAYVAPAAGRVQLGGEYAREWLGSKHKLKPSTRARYQAVPDTFIADHAAVAIGDVSRQLVREWVADLSRTHAPASVHKAIGVLRQVLAMAVAENRLVMNPVDGVELPSVESVEQRFLTLEQLHSLAAAAGGASAPPGVRARDVRAAVRRSGGAPLAGSRSSEVADPHQQIGDTRREQVRRRHSEER